MVKITESMKKILEILARENKPLTANEIANYIKTLKVSTIKKYLSQLYKEGYVSRGPLDTFIITPRGYEVIGVKHETPKVEVKKPEEKPKEEVEKPKPAEEVKAPPEVTKPAHLVEPFYFLSPDGKVVPLAIRSLEQLWAVVKYNIVPDEAIVYVVKSGFLEAWIKNVIGDEDLAKAVSGLRGASETEIKSKLLEALSKKIS